MADITASRDARLTEPDHLDVPVVFGDELRQLVLLARRRAEDVPGPPRPRSPTAGWLCRGSRVPGNNRSRVTLSVGVPDMTSRHWGKTKAYRRPKRNARTGELTPPGKYYCASWNKASDCLRDILQDLAK